ncbi:MAG: hypothetical protein ACKOFM_05210, partial [Actinomycetota bacterium]
VAIWNVPVSSSTREVPPLSVTPEAGSKYKKLLTTPKSIRLPTPKATVAFVGTVTTDPERDTRILP